MIKLKRNDLSRISRKGDFMKKNQKEGFVLLTSIILGSIIMAMALIMVQIMGKELAFNVELYNTEKAYYRAEAGVETGLHLLHSEALNHVENMQYLSTDTGDLEWDLNIYNWVKSTGTFYLNNSLTLGGNKIQTFRYAIDDTPNKVFSMKEPGSLSIETNPSGAYSWRILCKDNMGDTKSLQNNASGNISNLKGALGKYDIDHPSSLLPFANWANAEIIDKTSCYLQLQNLTASDMTFTLTPVVGGDGFAPLRSRLEAKGVSGKQEKIVKFDYDQNGIGTALNFSFINYQEN